MATDFWVSTHYKRWIVDRATLKQARTDDLDYVPEPEHLDFLAIYFADLISKLGKKLQFRQRVIATATPAATLLQRQKSPQYISRMLSPSLVPLFSQDQYGVKNFPSDNSKLAEMEFYLVDDLECDLIVFHPYRTLLALCKKESNAEPRTDSPPDEAEAGELGTGIGSDDGPRYWGTGQGKLELSEGALQTAWFIINDSYRSELCLLYPPHLIAITAIYLTLVLHTPTQNSIAQLLPYSTAFNSELASAGESTSTSATQSTPQPRRSTRQSLDGTSSSTSTPKKVPVQQDPIDFLADLNVSLSSISTIAQEIISMYNLWSRYREDATPEEVRNANNALHHKRPGQSQRQSQPGPSAPTDRRAPAQVQPQPQQLTQDEVQVLQWYTQLTNMSAKQYPPQQQPQRQFPSPYVAQGSVSPAKRSATGATIPITGSGSGSGTPDSRSGGAGSLFGDGSSGSPLSQPGQEATPIGGSGGSGNMGTGTGSAMVVDDNVGPNDDNNGWHFGEGTIITPHFLSLMLMRMREVRISDLAHPASGRPVVVNRMLERTGAGG